MQVKLSVRELQQIVAQHLTNKTIFGTIEPEQISFTNETHGAYEDIEFEFTGATFEIPADTLQ